MTKCIGIVDVTTVGATICARAIVEKAAKNDPTGEHPEFALHSISFKRYKEQVLAHNWDKLADIILESIEKLKRMGADFIIIPSNTPHYGFEKIAEKSPLPVLNLITMTAEECQSKGFKRVAVLGTTATMQGGLYNKALRSRGITPVIPNSTLCDAINSIIMDEIIPGKINPISVEKLAEQLKRLDCDAYILGCTELPEIYNQSNLGKPCIDTTRLLGYKALDYANNPSPQNDSLISESLSVRFSKK